MGRIVGDGDTVEFFAGDNALGGAKITVVAIDDDDNASIASLRLDIQNSGPASLAIFTSGIPVVPLAIVQQIRRKQRRVSPLAKCATSTWGTRIGRVDGECLHVGRYTNN